jgi:hypothetical protein
VSLLGFLPFRRNYTLFACSSLAIVLLEYRIAQFEAISFWQKKAILTLNCLKEYICKLCSAIRGLKLKSTPIGLVGRSLLLYQHEFCPTANNSAKLIVLSSIFLVSWKWLTDYFDISTARNVISFRSDF